MEGSDEGGNMKKEEYVERFFGGYRFFDDPSGFLLNLSGATDFDLERVLARERRSVHRALAFIRDIESGKIVNVSERRRVDHFNLRKGRGLKQSLAQWRRIARAIERITSGEVRAPGRKRYADVILNGIGGSFLGPLMMVIAHHGSDYNFASTLPVRMHFVNNTDPESFRLLMDKIDPRTSIMVNISKSGGTAETAGNMEAFNNILEKRKLSIGQHNITVTTPGSPFDIYSRRNRFLHVFHMNVETGGRTSVGSPVGMVPAAFAGLDFAEFLRGQSWMDGLTRRTHPRRNPAMLLALLINDLIQREGHKNQIFLGYSDALKEAAHYFQQLFMESLGKRLSRHGRLMRRPTGLTIFGGVGTGEQHAFMQQVQEGIRDCFVHFASFRKRTVDYANTKAGSMGRQFLGFVEGTQQALLENGRGFVSLVFEEQNEFNMGMLVALEERVVALLGGLWGINPFDQPGVQAGKLSADRHNAISAEVMAWLRKHRQFKGSALQMTRLLGRPTSDAPGVESVLLDAVSNHSVRHAYPGLEKFECSKRWRQNRFTFTISG